MGIRGGVVEVYKITEGVRNGDREGFPPVSCNTRSQASPMKLIGSRVKIAKGKPGFTKTSRSPVELTTPRCDGP